ncbi:MAG: nucleotidyltransferase domain-containing protein, partial [Nanoarchaeota archaeon]
LSKGLIDIIIFGSFVKGGDANDIDVALMAKDKVDVVAIKKELKGLFRKEVDVQVIGIESIYQPIWLTLIKEGFSVRKGEFIYGMYNIKPSVLYKYSLGKLSNVQKVKFERGIKSVLKDKGAFLTRSVVLVPIDLKNEMMEFLKSWDIYYESQEYELLPVLRKGDFL